MDFTEFIASQSHNPISDILYRKVNDSGRRYLGMIHEKNPLVQFCNRQYYGPWPIEILRYFPENIVSDFFLWCIFISHILPDIIIEYLNEGGSNTVTNFNIDYVPFTELIFRIADILKAARPAYHKLIFSVAQNLIPLMINN